MTSSDTHASSDSIHKEVRDGNMEAGVAQVSTILFVIWVYLPDVDLDCGMYDRMKRTIRRLMWISRPGSFHHPR